MSEYILKIGGMIFRTADSVFIPQDEENRDFIKYQEWVSDGNTPELETE